MTDRTSQELQPNCGTGCNAAVEIARTTAGTPTQKLIAILVASGITATAEIAAILGVTVRAVQKANANPSSRTTVRQANHSSRTTVRSEPEFANLSSLSKKEIPPTPPKEKTTTTSYNVEPQCLLAESAACVREKPAADAADAAPRKFDLKAISERLVAAANGSVCPQALALQTIAIPLGWLEAGADLELDVIPTIEAVGKRQHGAGITSWSYFTRPVAAAVKARKQGLPDVPAQAPQPKRRGVYAILQERIAEEATP